MINWDLVLTRIVKDEKIVNLKKALDDCYWKQKKDGTREPNLSLAQIEKLTKGEACRVSIGDKMKVLGLNLRGPGGPNNCKKEKNDGGENEYK